jgi:hypothetical protein
MARRQLTCRIITQLKNNGTSRKSPHVTPTDYYPFRVLKENLGGCKLKEYRKVKTLVARWVLNTRHGPTMAEKRTAPIPTV